MMTENHVSGATTVHRADKSAQTAKAQTPPQADFQALLLALSTDMVEAASAAAEVPTDIDNVAAGNPTAQATAEGAIVAPTPQASLPDIPPIADTTDIMATTAGVLNTTEASPAGNSRPEVNDESPRPGPSLTPAVYAPLAVTAAIVMMRADDAPQASPQAITNPLATPPLADEPPSANAPNRSPAHRPATEIKAALAQKPATTLEPVPAAPPPPSFPLPHADTQRPAGESASASPGVITTNWTPPGPFAITSTPQPANAPSASEIRISTPVATSGWPEEIAQSIRIMTSAEIQRAELVLTPPELGRIEVTIEVQGDQASAYFVAPSAEVRTALQDALPRLQEMMTTAGITLGNTGFDNRPNRQSSQAGDRVGYTSGERRETQSAATVVERSGQSIGMVDTFA